MLKSIKVLLAAGVMLVLAAQPARADFEITFSVGSQSVTFDLNPIGGGPPVVSYPGTTPTSTNAATGPTLNFLGLGTYYTGYAPAVGVATITSLTITQPPSLPPYVLTGTISLTLDGFAINANLDTSNSPGGLPSGLMLGNTSITDVSAGAKALTITTSSTGFTSPSSSSLNVFDTLDGQGAAGNTQAVQLSDNAYVNGALAVSIGATAVTAGNSVALNPNSVVVGGVVDPFTLTNTFTASFAASGDSVDNAGSNMHVTGNTIPNIATPAPAGLVLFLTAIPIFGLTCLWRRRAKTSLAV